MPLISTFAAGSSRGFGQFRQTILAVAGGGGVPSSVEYLIVAGGGGGGGGSTLGGYTGGGGGGGTRNVGGSTPAAGAAGGSGVVVIRYADSFANATSTTGSPTLTISGGYRIYTWTGSGSITF